MRPWRISVYDALLGGEPVSLPSGPTRFLYVHDGAAALADDDGTETLPAGAGRFCRGTMRLTGRGTAWVYEAGPSGPILDVPGLSLVLSRPLALGGGPHMVRADRMEAAPGGITPHNLHPGPSAFVRVMVLPPELQGGLTSFVATDPTEAAKPRAVQQHIFGEMVVARG